LGRLGFARAELDANGMIRDQQGKRIAALSMERARLQTEMQRLAVDIEEITHSTSWRVTGHLRRINQILKRS